MNKYHRLIARWAYEPILQDYIADAVQDWLQEKEEYARGLDKPNIMLMLQDCHEALEANDLVSLPDEWLAMFLTSDVIFSVKAGRHFLYAEARRALMEEVSKRAVLWALDCQSPGAVAAPIAPGDHSLNGGTSLDSRADNPPRRQPQHDQR